MTARAAREPHILGLADAHTHHVALVKQQLWGIAKHIDQFRLMFFDAFLKVVRRWSHS